ncbi:hypothetical protein DRN76_04540 [Methanosarcinales archaeon]|nr:MAG: hypothetical protein DRN76_04540 [Methanosarcinales archaeon]
MTNYMYRGTSLREAQNVIKGGKTGGFWSNYYDTSYIHGALLVAKNKEPQLKWKGEIPKRYYLFLKDIVRILVDARLIGLRFPLDLVQVYPVLTKRGFKKLCTTSASLKLLPQLYNEYIAALKKHKLYVE